MLRKLPMIKRLSQHGSPFEAALHLTFRHVVLIHRTSVRKGLGLHAQILMHRMQPLLPAPLVDQCQCRRLELEQFHEL